MSDPLLAMALSIFIAATAVSATAAPTAPAGPQVPPFTSLAMTLKLDHDEGGEHMCPTNGQLTSFQVYAGVDNAPIPVELLGPDHKPMPEKGWSTVAGLRVLPLVLGPLRIVMICSSR